MFSRQKALLELVDRAGGRIERMRLMKLAFLVRQEHLAGDAAFYGFVPYRFGPCSFTLYHDAAKLERDGWLVEEGRSFRRVGIERQPRPMPTVYLEAIDAVWRLHGRRSSSDLLDLVYDRYPWFTIHSDYEERRATKAPVADPAVYTAGYEGLGLEDFLDRLLRAGVRRLIDVRANPVARRFGFHRSTLDRNCDRLGIDYVHMGDLGIPGELRTDLFDQAARDRLFARYRAEILPRREEAIERARSLVEEMPSVLVCMEAAPCECHRTHLGEELARRTGLPLKDLGTRDAA